MKGPKKQLDIFKYQEELYKERQREVLLQEATSASTPQQRLLELVRIGDGGILEQLAKNPNAPRELLNELALVCPKEVLRNPAWELFLLEDDPLKGFSVSSLKALLQEPNSQSLYVAASNHPSTDIKRDLAMRPDCSSELLEYLLSLGTKSQHSWELVAEVVAEHPNLSQRHAERLLFSEVTTIRCSAMLNPKTHALQERLGKEFINALYQYVPQKNIPLPLTEAQRAVLLEIPSEMSARVLLWDLETPEEVLLACYRSLPEGPSPATMSMLVSHPNCPPALWPDLFERDPSVFLFQNRAPAEYTQKAIEHERELSFYELWVGDESQVQTRKGLHQASFSADALLCYLPFALAHCDTSLIHIIASTRAISPWLHTIWADNQTQPTEQRNALLSGIFSNEAAPESLMASLFVESRQDEILLGYLANNPSLPVSLQRAMLENEPRGYPEWRSLSKLAQNPGLSLEIQREMFQGLNTSAMGFRENLWKELLLNPSLDKELLAKIFEGANTPELQARCAAHPEFPQEKQQALIEQGEEPVLVALSQRKDLTKDRVDRIIERAERLPGHKGNQIWRTLALNPALSEETYHRLFKVEICHEGLSRNQSTPTSLLLLLATNKNYSYNIISRRQISRSLLREHGLSALDIDDIPF